MMVMMGEVRDVNHLENYIVVFCRSSAEKWNNPGVMALISLQRGGGVFKILILMGVANAKMSYY